MVAVAETELQMLKRRLEKRIKRLEGLLRHGWISKERALMNLRLFEAKLILEGI